MPIRKERKELFAGARSECEEWLSQKDERTRNRMEVVALPAPGPECAVYWRRKAHDQTIKKPVSRETRELFKVNGVTKNHKRPLIVSLEPGDTISFRPKGTQQVIQIPISAAYNSAKFAVARSMAAKKQKGKGRKARK